MKKYFCPKCKTIDKVDTNKRNVYATPKCPECNKNMTERVECPDSD